MRFIILSVVWSIVLFSCAGKTEQVKAKYVFILLVMGWGLIK